MFIRYVFKNKACLKTKSLPPLNYQQDLNHSTENDKSIHSNYCRKPYPALPQTRGGKGVLKTPFAIITALK